MAGLSNEQKSAVAEWFAAGAGVAEIQKRISEEFGIDLTYLDVRLLVADLPQPVEPDPPASEPAAEASGLDADAAGFDAASGDAEAEVSDGTRPMQGTMPQDESSGDQPLAELSVSVDPLAPPGAIACGSVVFSDGTAGKWVLDQMGRLGLSGLPEGYRPPPEDGAQFQAKLVAALRAKGLA